MKQKIGRYQIEAHLGSGAYADVYQATDTVLKRTVALKLLKPALLADEEAFARFVQEAQTAAGLFHPSIATVLDLGEVEGRYFIAMRYVDGVSLDQLIERRGPLPWAEALRIVEQVASALDFAHARGLVHRDIKPGNILVSEVEGAVLTDFGLVRALESSGVGTRTGSIMGTPQYIPPEVWKGQPATPAADQYALACVLVEMLTGQVLYNGPTPWAVMNRHAAPPELPGEWPEGVPVRLTEMLRRALAQEPGERCPSAGAFFRTLVDSSKEPLQTFSKTEAPIRMEESGLHANALEKEPDNNQSERIGKKEDQRIYIILGLVLILALAGGAIGVRGGLLSRRIATPDEKTTTLTGLITDAQGVKMAKVPAGDFQMGSDNGSENEKPVHTVYLDNFYIDIYEVTNALYEQCMQAGVCSAPSLIRSNSRESYFGYSTFADYPVVYVDWGQASEFCAWRGARLPKEAEWEKAARGGLEGMEYPWGNEIPVCTPGAANGANFENCSENDTMKVGSFLPNGYGLYDMAGNVWEWAADWYFGDYYSSSANRNPIGPENGEVHVLRGGAWGNQSDVLRTALRLKPEGNSQSSGYRGFRCARSP